jgi:hypothetical protein
VLVLDDQVLYNSSLPYYSLSAQVAKSDLSFNMGSPEPYVRSKVDYNLPKRPFKVVKKRPQPRKPRKRLFNPAIDHRSDAMQMYVLKKRAYLIEG